MERYYHVAPWKFVLLSLSTFGLYVVYWFYMAWRSIKVRDSRPIWPWARALFGVFWFYYLADDVEDERGRGDYAGLLAGAFVLSNLVSRVPAVGWLLGTVAVTLCVLPLVRWVDEINREAGVVGPGYRRFGFWQTAVAVVGGLFIAMALFGTAAELFGTPAVVVEGQRVPESHHAWMRSNDLLGEQETLAWFYSAAVWDWAEDGNYLTDQRVASYWDQEGVLQREQAAYGEVASWEVAYAENEFDNTQVLILRRDGSDFLLYLSSEGDQDRAFVETLARRVEAATPIRPSVPS